MPISSEEKRRAQLPSMFVGIADSLAPDPTLPINSPICRTHRDFGGGAVGLGIVAALIAGAAAPQRSDPIAIAAAAALQRSDPIAIAAAAALQRSDPIVIAARPAARTEMIVSITEEEEEEEEEERTEMSESYTCVTSLVGGRAVSKRVYFHGGGDGNWVTRVPIKQVSPVKLALSAPVAAEFLSHCDLCGKKLSGLDIFMYKGDKAFCSVECRWQQILGDELIEQCGPGAMKGFDLSASPCSAPLLFAPGVTAA